MRQLPPTWLGLFLICFGNGALVWAAMVRFGGRPFRVAPGIFQLFWIGFTLVIGLIEAGSLVHPVDGHLLALVCFTGLAGSLPAWRIMRHACRGQDALAGAVRLALLLVATFVVAHQATHNVEWSDTLSTHLQQVRWARTYGAVPGLAALNPKLGFDQAHHLFAALIDLWIWRDRSVHVALAFLFMVIVAQWLVVLTTTATREEDERAKIFAALTLPYLAGKAMTCEVASLSGDLAMSMVTLVGVLELLRLRLDWHRATRSGTFGLFVCVTLGALVFAVKFSSLPFVAVALLLAGYGAWRGWFTRRPRALIALAALPAFLVLGVMARRIVLSGWPLYPIPLFRVRVPWALSLDVTREQYLWIKSWARIPGQSYTSVLDNGFFHWFLPWFEGFRKSHEMVLLLLGGAALVGWATSKRLRRQIPRTPSVLAAVLAGVLCLTYWFLGAPDLRFGSVFFWILVGVALAPMLAVEARSGTTRLLVFLFATWLVSWNGGFDFSLPAEPDWKNVEVARVYRVNPIIITAPDGTSFTAFAPLGDDFCGNVDLPCTPAYLARHQKLRRQGRLGSGFLP